MDKLHHNLQSTSLTKEYIVDSISQIDDVSIESSDENGLLVWDDQDAKTIPFHFLENLTPTKLADLIYASQDIPQKYQIDKTLLAEYLWNTCDKNAFITLDEIAVIWSEPDDPDTFEPSDFVDSTTKHLLEKFGDEYAYEIGSGFLGQLWFERNVVVVNMGEIVRASEKTAHDNQDLCDPYFTLENQVLVCFLTTMIHELRHLQMDTNIILPEDSYPLSLASEVEVENYCLDAFENSEVNPNILSNLFSVEKLSLEQLIQSAESRKPESHAFTEARTNEPIQMI